MIELASFGFAPPLEYLTSSNLKEYMALIRHWSHRLIGDNPNNHLNLSHTQFNDYFKFAVVRNPWARVYSWYKNVLSYKPHQNQYKIPPDISFKAFIKKVIADRDLSPFSRGYFTRSAARPQLDYLIDCQGRLGVDFVCRFENLDADFKKIIEHLNTEVKLAHLLKSKGPDYREVYDEEDKELILACYRPEIEYFQYEFET